MYLLLRLNLLILKAFIIIEYDNASYKSIIVYQPPCSLHKPLNAKTARHIALRDSLWRVTVDNIRNRFCPQILRIDGVNPDSLS